MSTIVNDRDVLLQATSPRLVPATLPDSLYMSAVKGLLLLAPGFNFQVNTSGVASPSSFLITATVKQISGTIGFAVVSGAATLTGSGNTRTLSYSNVTTFPVTVRASVVDTDGTLYSSDITFTKVTDGSTGITGSRGSLTVYASTKYGMTQTPTNLATWLATDADPYTGTGTVGGIDQYANRAIFNVINNTTGNVQLNSTAHLIIGDTVTIMDATTVGAATVAVTKYWSGTGWIKPGLVIDGNLLVNGTISASKINGGTITGVSINIGSGVFQVNGSGIATMSGIIVSQSTFGNLFDPTKPPIKAQVSSGSQPAISAIAGSGNSIEATGDVVGTAATVAGLYGKTTSASLLGVRADQTNASGTTLSAYNSGSSKQAHLGTASYAAFSPTSGGKQYFVDGAGPFTGFHPGLAPHGVLFEVGDIVVDVEIIWKPDVSNTLGIIETSSQPNQRGALGVVNEVKLLTVEVPYDKWWELAPTYALVDVNALGEGQINVCGEGGDIEAGDFIVTSSMPGKGMRADRDMPLTAGILSTFVAKARENITFDGPTQVKQVACIYVSG